MQAIDQRAAIKVDRFARVSRLEGALEVPEVTGDAVPRQSKRVAFHRQQAANDAEQVVGGRGELMSRAGRVVLRPEQPDQPLPSDRALRCGSEQHEESRSLPLARPSRQRFSVEADVESAKQLK